MTVTEELVVLLDEQGHAIGTTPKAGVHHTDTPLHLAFSCYLFDAGGRLLLTRRALSKPTWPGAWTNSVCGHPGPGESLADAVRRRVGDEVGVRAVGVTLMLPAFRYRAVMPDGVVENEMCPVFVATATGEVDPDPGEVEDHRWVDWSDFRRGVLDGSQEISPWCRDQVAQLPEDPLTAPARGGDSLPPAARV
ncbi:isopentenyl-diphosphate Delta-isomerase [Nocardioides psychrotolerans]|uniref:Isopentenyl-diphosphate Delta-isomerase n=1 Tax=Nocardioides psychrotolerans TaxID=1005945 RepID=A0A1I3JEW4_9ACTN|nr:isopentenyl-diphosphate Delta-isomerase [Nocardioides psychrotolerans]GEP38175.1 isopentenyl-diphosphate Delta-isomerase [Nocardioides psychrotolerans]SFI58817.1 isopentenyl-diphosphate delta-isomerase [Nocardioides psychrotolerans]